MTQIRDLMLATLLHQNNPWADFESNFPTGIQGWNSTHPWLGEGIAEIRPQIVVEIGVWKGASVVHMAAKMRELGLNGAVIAVDTWLGSSELWSDERWAKDLPDLYHQFLDGIWATGLTDYVIPLRLDSLNAAQLLKRHGIRPHMIHLDAGHDFNSVSADLGAWWPLLASGGLYIGDDYHEEVQFPELKLATDMFFEARGGTLEYVNGKCRVRKNGC